MTKRPEAHTPVYLHSTAAGTGQTSLGCNVGYSRLRMYALFRHTIPAAAREVPTMNTQEFVASVLKDDVSQLR